MNAHQIGQHLRHQILSDQQQGRALDARRLQALIADLCGEDERELIAPLRHLLLSAAFSSAAGMQPPLADERHLPRLARELQQLFAPRICSRMEPVLHGLLGMPADTAGADAALGPAGAAAQTRPAAETAAEAQPMGVPMAAEAGREQRSSPELATTTRAGSGTALNAVLAFLSGVLLMALAGVGLLTWQRASGDGPNTTTTNNNTTTTVPAAPTTDTAAEPAAPAAAGLEPPSPEAATKAPGPSEVRREADSESGSTAAAERAVASLQQLFSALSSKDFNQAQSLYGAGAADQFGAAFYRQFERVSVQDLRVTSNSGSTVNLEGMVTFLWPDGSIQTETRSFSVDTSSEPAVVSASEFGRVLSPRR